MCYIHGTGVVRRMSKRDFLHGHASLLVVLGTGPGDQYVERQTDKFNVCVTSTVYDAKDVQTAGY